MIADLASIPMSDVGVPISNGIIPIFGLLLMHLMISFANLKSIKFRELICGKPTILIYRGRIDEAKMKKERYTINELQERLRGKDVFNIGDVEYAILETSGEINIILKPEKRNPTLDDLNIEAKYEGIAYDLVIDGIIQYDNLNKIKKDYKWLKSQVGKFGFNPEDALVVTIDGDNQIYFSGKDGGKMSKEIIISFMIVIIVIALDVWVGNITDSKMGYQVGKIEELKSEVEKDNYDEAKKKIEEVKQEWDNSENMFSFYIEHDELEKVSAELTSLDAYIKKEDDSSLESVNKVIYLIKHIEEKYDLKLKNIF